MEATLERVERVQVVEGQLMLLNESEEVLATANAHEFFMSGGSTGDPVDDAPWPDDVPWYTRY